MPVISIDIADGTMHPYPLDRLLKFYWDLFVTVDNPKIIQCAFPLLDGTAEPDVAPSLTTLDALIQLHLLSLDFQDDFLAACIFAKLRHNLRHGYFELEELFGSIRLVYSLDIQVEENRAMQAMFLSAALRFSLALRGGEKRALFQDVQAQVVRFGKEYALAMNWDKYVGL